MSDEPNSIFGPRGDARAVEQGLTLAPKFDEHGLIPAIVSDHRSGEVLMFAWMNGEALRLTIETSAATSTAGAGGNSGRRVRRAATC